MIRYRVGIDQKTGRVLTGRDHLWQSIARIIHVQLTEMVMLLDFGSSTVRHIGRNMTLPEVLSLYQDAVKAIHRWEPEFRVRRIELVKADRTGVLALAPSGTYFPEGRFGNYDLQEVASGALPLVAAARGAFAA